ncbi:MAG: hypothetical protein HUU06_05010 [Planctomycetaceae bacterium]|nr:hypothetical protein [Planctomycetaceae bacterium]
MKAAAAMAVLVLLLAPSRGVRAQDAPPARGVDRARLPVLGTVGDLPPVGSRIVVEVEPKGWMTVDGRASGHAEFLKALRTKAAPGRPEKGPSPLHLVLRVDRDLPWQAVRWILAECAAPDVRVRRVFFAAVPEDGGEEGAFAFFQPEDPLPEARSWRFELRLREVREPLCPGDVYASMDTLGSRLDPAEYYSSVSVRAVPRMATGEVLSTADMILRRGTRDLRLEGAAPETVPDIEQALKAMPPAPGTYSPWMGGPLRPFGERARRPPPVARVKGSFAGIFPAAGPGPEEAPAPPKAEQAVRIAGSPGFLPRIGVVGDLPAKEERIVIDVDSAGRTAINDRPEPFAAIEEALGAEAGRCASPKSPGVSDLNVVLRLDRRLPWAVAHRLLRICERTRPRVPRILFGVCPEDGGAEGAVAAFAPRFARPGEPSEVIPEGHSLEVRIGNPPGAPEGGVPRDVLGFLREKRGPSPEGGPWLFRFRSLPDTRVGTVLEVYDMVLRWGVRMVTLGCDFDDDDRDPAALIDRYPPTGAPPLFFVGEDVVQPGNSRGMDLPLRPRIAGRIAGATNPSLVLSVEAAGRKANPEDDEDR